MIVFMSKGFKPVVIACKGATKLPLDTILEFQGELKELSKESYGKFKDQLLELGFSEPISVWDSDGKMYCLNGHQRLRTLKAMREEGYVIPQELPVNLVEAKSLKEAKKKVLALTSQYGRITEEGLYEFANKAGISFEDLKSSFRLPEIDFDKFEKSYGSGEESLSEDEINDYSKKIKAPIYEPRGEKPKIDDLYDFSKTEKLIKEIDASKLKPELKNFLKLSAYRHVVFKYDKIAEFYAHADKATQKLMENSALVIIDFEKAIENGFVALTKDLADAYTEEP